MADKVGKLRDRIKILRSSGGKTATGFPIDSWSTWRECWADVRFTAGQEVVSANQVQANRTHVITCRYFEGLSPKDRIEWREKTLDIVNFGDAAGDRRWLQISATEGN